MMASLVHRLVGWKISSFTFCTTEPTPPPTPLDHCHTPIISCSRHLHTLNHTTIVIFFTGTAITEWQPWCIGCWAGKSVPSLFAQLHPTHTHPFDHCLTLILFFQGHFHTLYHAIIVVHFTGTAATGWQPWCIGCWAGKSVPLLFALLNPTHTPLDQCLTPIIS